jgi:hypothetical protein
MIRAVVIALLVAACGGGRSARPAECPEPPVMVTAAELATSRDPDAVSGTYVRLDELFDLYEKNNALKDAEEQQAASAAIEELRALDDRMCACRDRTCADAAWADLEQWADRHATTKSGKAEADEAGRLIEHLQACMAEATR